METDVKTVVHVTDVMVTAGAEYLVKSGLLGPRAVVDGSLMLVVSEMLQVCLDAGQNSETTPARRATDARRSRDK